MQRPAIRQINAFVVGQVSFPHPPQTGHYALAVLSLKSSGSRQCSDAEELDCGGESLEVRGLNTITAFGELPSFVVRLHR